MMALVLKAAIALVAGHALPGALIVARLRLGRSLLDRLVMALVLGGPLAAGVYFLALVVPLPGLYWVVLGVVDLAAISTWLRSRTARDATGSARGGRDLALLLLIALVVDGAYLATTAPLFRFDRGGNFVMDPAFQEDELFHVGMVRALEVSYPPQLLSEAGTYALYHVGYDLQVAAWSRFFGIDPFDGFHRVAPLWYLPLLVLSVYLFARRFGERRAALVSAILVFGSGLGFLFHDAPGADWWSLVFMDATLVSLFLVNPLLPALSLFFIGSACLQDYLEEKDGKALAAAAYSMGFLVVLKIFLALQMLVALAFALALALGHGRRSSAWRRYRNSGLPRATLVLCLAAAPLLAGMMAETAYTNTTIGIRPLEIVRYSMEVLGRHSWARQLALVGEGHLSLAALSTALPATALWLAGFLGLRLVALPGVLRDAFSSVVSLRRPLALLALLSFPMSLVLRIAPPDAHGLSRTEALNDAFWFVTDGGILLWFWTAEALVSASTRLAGGAALVASLTALLAFPGTVQYFTHKNSLAPEVVPASVVEATEECRELSAPSEVFLEPLDRNRPSLRAYLAGRPVVNDLFVGYDYMFISREEIELRHHAVAQFWATTDPGYAAWLLNRFHVRWVYVPRGESLPTVSVSWAKKVFENEAATIYRIAPRVPTGLTIAPPSRIPLGDRGDKFLGKGWSAPEGIPKTRRLFPGTARLYLPLGEGLPIALELHFESSHPAGRLALDDTAIQLEAERTDATLPVATRKVANGLTDLGITWEGGAPLRVTSLTLSTLAWPQTQRDRRDRRTSDRIPKERLPGKLRSALPYPRLSF